VAARVDEIEIRPADAAREEALIRSIDRSFETDLIFDVQDDEGWFRLVEMPVDPPATKTFPLAEPFVDREWESTWLALDGERAVGVVSTAYEAWDRRIVIWHFYVTVGYRQLGIGRRLLEAALEAARSAGARTAWLETNNLNVPGVRAYERLGFRLCGLDTSLYRGTPAEGEVALFLCRSLDEPG
jgi:ribosomal protein S18 acetylase RimI-like enzyme